MVAIIRQTCVMSVAQRVFSLDLLAIKTMSKRSTAVIVGGAANAKYQNNKIRAWFDVSLCLALRVISSWKFDLFIVLDPKEGT